MYNQLQLLSSVSSGILHGKNDSPCDERLVSCSHCNLIKNSQAVKKGCGLQKSHGEKRCEIQGGGQEMAVTVGYWKKI